MSGWGIFGDLANIGAGGNVQVTTPGGDVVTGTYNGGNGGVSVGNQTIYPSN